ncbi:hypothetical protein DPMN_117958 [Dreissena polymorpha]|uniref:Uncharacterized protein n=1 Tax=Dreissena polymorpha TaxID=45954 RepID=A0A9D4JQN9_DREPO|nr:hypothetical protein DPMN_117958 [Dreissena polymorpha]
MFNTNNVSSAGDCLLSNHGGWEAHNAINVEGRLDICSCVLWCKVQRDCGVNIQSTQTISSNKLHNQVLKIKYK